MRGRMELNGGNVGLPIPPEADTPQVISPLEAVRDIGEVAITKLAAVIEDIRAGLDSFRAEHNSGVAELGAVVLAATDKELEVLREKQKQGEGLTPREHKKLQESRGRPVTDNPSHRRRGNIAGSGSKDRGKSSKRGRR